MTESTPRMMGVETEYAFALLDQHQSRLDPVWSLTLLMDAVRRHLPHLRGPAGGVFLSTGGRLYLDCGHPELTTPECTSPTEAVCYVEAGHRLLQQVIEQLASEQPEIGRTFLGRCHVDYVNGATWGCHESYLHRCSPRRLPTQLIPHLVSRILYTGSGGFNNRSPALEFLLEPRTPHLVNPVSASSTGSRGIFHSKNETLSSKGYNRLHVLAGSSNCSHLANWLKLGTTALIVAIVDQGARPGNSVRLADPVAALQTLSRDVQAQVPLSLASGTAQSPVEIQRHYLEAVEKRLGEPYMPDWAPRVCRYWRSVLDDLDSTPQALCRTLDWPLRLLLYRQYAESKGFQWMDNRPRLDDPAEMAQLRSDLLQIDTRFGEIGGDGIFQALDRAGSLDHAAPGVNADTIEAYLTQPPERGRAHLRGQLVQRFSPQTHILCDWRALFDSHSGQSLDLSDPFQEVDTEPVFPGGPRDPQEGPQGCQVK